jgi:heme-degrading monooxygenase HmoA
MVGGWRREGRFVAVSRFEVANGLAEAVKDAFAARPHLVDAASGFRRMEVMSPLENPDEIWLLTWWDDEASFRTWHHSHAYHDAHRGIPRGRKLRPQRTTMQYCAAVAS